MLVELPDAGALPAPSRFGPTWQARREGWEVVAEIGGDGRTRAVEVKAPSQFIGDQGEVQRFADRQELLQKPVHVLGPRRPPIAPGRLRTKPLTVFEPLVTQVVELGSSNVQSLRRGSRIQGASVELGEDLSDVLRREPMSQLLVFIASS